MEVSKNHNIPIGEVIERKFDPEIQLLIRYYSHQFHLEYKEYQKIKKEQEEFNNK